MSWIPRSHSEILNGAVILEDFGKLEGYIAVLTDVSSDAAGYQGHLDASSTELFSMASDSITAITSKVTGVLMQGRATVAETADTARAAFAVYASDVDSIHTQAKSLQFAVDDALGTLGWRAAAIASIGDEIGIDARYSWDTGPPLTMPEPIRGPGADDSPLQPLMQSQILADSDRRSEWAANAASWHAIIGELVSARTQWAALIDARIGAENRLVSALRETPVGSLIALAGATGIPVVSALAYGVAGELHGSTLGTGNTVDVLLVTLIGTTNGSDIWNNPPKPEIVAEAWDNLTESERQRLIESVPWVIGNLPGLPFGARDAANRNLLDYYVSIGPLLNPRAQVAMNDLVAVMNAQAYDPDTPFMIVSLDFSTPLPFVAVGLGTLDEATNITWQVPGMDNDADSALADWYTATKNLHLEQTLLSDDVISGVISFLSYDTPAPAQEAVWEVLNTERAFNGADRLAAELDGTHFTQSEPPRVAVLAHSYGTTTTVAALSRTDHDVASLTLIGSAGVSIGQDLRPLIPLAGDIANLLLPATMQSLHVDAVESGPKAIYTTNATADVLAPTGAVISGRGIPGLIPGLFTFSSDGAVDNGQVYAPTDGHTVIGNDDNFGYIAATEGHGYLDIGTQSLANAAATTLGHIDAIVGTIAQIGKHW